jgi:hypothetical protein
MRETTTTTTNPFVSRLAAPTVIYIQKGKGISKYGFFSVSKKTYQEL